MQYNSDPPGPNNDQTMANFPTYSTQQPYTSQFYQPPPNPNYQQQSLSGQLGPYQQMPHTSQFYQPPPNPNYQQQPQPLSGQPGPYQQMPPVKPPKASKKKIFAVGCGSLIAILFLCSLCSVAFRSGNKSQTASVQTQSTHAALDADHTPTIVAPTATSTPSSTPTPTPTATLAPTPTPVQQNQPTPPPVQQPAPTQPPPSTQPPAPTCNGATINGACYNTDPNGGTLVYSPPSTFCNYFTCVSSFWTATSGYVAECANAKYTHSGGVSGACSKDGGVIAAVYQH